MKRFIKINFGTNQKFIFNGRINDTYHEPDKRNGLLDVFQVNEINLSLREATAGQVMFGGVRLEIPSTSWGIGINPSHLLDTSNLKLTIEGETITASGEMIIGISLKDGCIEDLNRVLPIAFVHEISLWNVESYSTRNPCEFTLTGHWQTDQNLVKEIVVTQSNPYWQGSIEVLAKKPKLK